MGRYSDRDDPVAEEILERLLGHSFAIKEYTVEYELGKSHSQIHLLNHKGITKCRGFVEFPEMMFSGWCDVPVEAISIIDDVLDIPPSIFGTKYKKVEITYRAGSEEIPQELQDAVIEISDELAKHGAMIWNIPLSERTLMAIRKYHRGEGIR